MGAKTFLRKTNILILILFLGACQENNEDEDLIKLPYSVQVEIEINNELMISQELSDCNFAIASQNGNYLFSGNDSIPGHRIVQKGFNYLGIPNDDKDIVGVNFIFNYARDFTPITVSEVEEFVNGFSTQSLDQSFIYPRIKINFNEDIYSTIKLDQHLSELNPRNYDKNAIMNINQIAIDETYYCNQEKTNVIELSMNYIGKLYNDSNTDSIQVKANYSVILE